MPQRSMAQTVPSGAIDTLAVEPHRRPAGNWPHATPSRYGLGRSLRTPVGATAGRAIGYVPAAKTDCAGFSLAGSGGGVLQASAGGGVGGTNFITLRSPIDAPQITPDVSTVIPSGKLAPPFGAGSGIKVVTMPSLTLPM